jgi:heptosyltransferase-3
MSMLAPRRALVFRLGSIGDFVIAAPCFHLIRQVHAATEIALLTNLPAHDRIVPAEAVLRGTGLVDRYIHYPGGTRDFRHLRALKREIEIFAPDVLIYLTEPRGTLSIYRDYMFFRWCGIRHFVGLSPFGPQEWLMPVAGSDLQESESARLSRQIVAFGAVDFRARQAWDLNFSRTEKSEAAKCLDDCFPEQWHREHLLGFSVGTKQSINDWGDDNWRTVLDALRCFGFGIVLVGGGEDRQRSERLVADWPAPVLNLCGTISPRVSAAVLSQVRLFLCHDSGPMHLAAAVGTPCVAVFSRRNPPGKWFPAGTGHRVLYPTAHSGTIASINPYQVIAAAVDAIGEVMPRPAPTNLAAA